MNLQPIKEQEKVFSLKDIVLRYLNYFPLFLVFLAISYAAGIMYVRYTQPVYMAQTQILVKSGDENNALPAVSNDFLQYALSGGRAVNLENEVIRIKSIDLMERVVRKRNYHIQYREKGKFRSSNLHASSPFIIESLSVKDSSAFFNISFNNYDEKGVYPLIGQGLPDFIAWNKPIEFRGWKFQVNPVQQNIIPKETIVTVSWKNPKQVAREFSSSLSVATVGKTASIIQVSMRCDMPNLGMDVLDDLAEEFALQSVEKKNRAAESTMRFIDERLELLSQELDEIESKLVQLRKDNKLLDLSAYYIETFNKASNTTQEEDEMNLQLELLDLLESEVSKPTSNSISFLPSYFGVREPLINTAISDHNNLVTELEREKSVNAINSQSVIDLKNRVVTLRKNILTYIRNYKEEMRKRKASLFSRKEKYGKELQKIPETDRELNGIKNQQALKKQLYLFLLQRREETAIATTTTISNYDQIDNAVSSWNPVEPKAANIRNFSILIGLLIPVIIVYLIELFNEKVTSKEDITKLTALPIVGEIAHFNIVGNMSVLDMGSRSFEAEQFRILRSNLAFLAKDGNPIQTIMITSTMSGEGKSFVCFNLALTLTLLEKKVALLQFDLRKLNIDRFRDGNWEGDTSKGITNFLIGQTQATDQLYLTSEKFPFLHVYPSGPLPPNPAELIDSKKTTDLFTQLRTQYDYIIIDSPPVGLVSDPMLLDSQADATIFIIRHRFTTKKQVEMMNQLAATGKIKRMVVAVNDVLFRGRYGYYGYSYGYPYKYGGPYGYYGYGAKDKSGYFITNDIGKHKPWWKKIIKR